MRDARPGRHRPSPTPPRRERTCGRAGDGRVEGAALSADAGTGRQPRGDGPSPEMELRKGRPVAEPSPRLENGDDGDRLQRPRPGSGCPTQEGVMMKPGEEAVKSFREKFFFLWHFPALSPVHFGLSALERSIRYPPAAPPKDPLGGRLHRRPTPALSVAAESPQIFG